MTPDRRSNIFLIMTSTATVLMITAMCLARFVDAMATNRSTESRGDPQHMTYADDKLGQALQIKGLLINECCSNGEILNEALDCKDVEKKDNIDVIANSIAVDELLKPVKMNPDNILSSPHYRSICSDDKFEVVFWPKDGQPKTHYINHTSGELLLVHNGTVDKIFSPITYCVDEAMHDGQMMYALMLCPCTVTTCIQKCCLEGEYFDTAANICAPLKDDVSGFQPQLHQIKNESSNNTPYYLTEGSPKCGNSLERLQLNITRAYPQESGWLMLDDVGMGRYVFYERGKYCMDTFYDSATNDSVLGAFVCNGNTSNYTYEEVASRKEMEELEPAIVRASRRMHHFKEVMNLTELENVTELMTLTEIMNLTELENVTELMNVKEMMNLTEQKNVTEVMNLTEIMNLTELENVTELMNVKEMMNLTELKHVTEVMNLTEQKNVTEVMNLTEIMNLTELENVTDLMNVKEMMNLTELKHVTEVMNLTEQKNVTKVMNLTEIMNLTELENVTELMNVKEMMNLTELNNVTEVMNLTELKNVTEVMNVKDVKNAEKMMNKASRSDDDQIARADEDRMPEINIKSFDSKAGAAKMMVLGK